MLSFSFVRKALFSCYIHSRLVLFSFILCYITSCGIVGKYGTKSDDGMSKEDTEKTDSDASDAACKNPFNQELDSLLNNCSVDLEKVSNFLKNSGKQVDFSQKFDISSENECKCNFFHRVVFCMKQYKSKDIPKVFSEIIGWFLCNTQKEIVNGQTGRQVAPFHDVVIYGNKYILDLFMNEREVDVNIQDKHGRFPLYYALECRENFLYLLQHKHASKFKMKQTDNTGKSILHYLVYDYRNAKFKEAEAEAEAEAEVDIDVIDIISKLQKLGADINAKEANNNKFAPLHILADPGNKGEASNVELLNKFLKLKDLKKNIQDKQGCTPLHIAIVCDNLEAVIIFLEDSDVHLYIENNDEFTPFRLAMTGLIYCKKKEILLNIVKKFLETERFNVQNKEDIYQLIKDLNIKNMDVKDLHSIIDKLKKLYPGCADANIGAFNEIVHPLNLL